ncbi:MAG: primosomal protein N' [Gammaproteobacteria bacterium]
MSRVLEVQQILEVAVDAPLMGVFDYLAPLATEAPLQVGQRLRVPFGRSTRMGWLVGSKAVSDVPEHSLRRVSSVLDATPLLPPDLLRMLVWASRYYQHPLGEVLSAALPKALREGRDLARGEMHWTLSAEGRSADPDELRRAPAQLRIYRALKAAAGPVTAAELEAVSSNWRRAIAALAARGWISVSHSAVPPPVATVAPDEPPVLTAGQAQAVAEINAARGFHCFLLDGVTGSGKTEVYLRCMAQALAAGRQSLVLVPEIGLTPQLLERFQRRFPVPIALLHSGLSDGERLRAFTAAGDGSAAIVIGTRSAIFAPLLRPGLIVADEEHDPSYKQQEGWRYSARDLAVWRARELGVPLVLGSATPSLESMENAHSGRYTRLALPARTGAAGQPQVSLVDLRQHATREGLSQPLLAAIRRHLDAGGQVLIYLNRRGYAPVLMCPGCGHVLECRRCDARMVLHQQRGQLACHHCGSERPVPARCPDCAGELKAVGQGTERLERALAAAFPDQEIERIDRDTTRRRGEIERRLDRVRRQEARILMGTQMLTKGHDFPRVTLVGIIDADQGLFGSDFRSAERLAQSFVQVAGRAGRAEHPGEVWLQTLFPDHPLLRVLIAEGYAQFARLALEERRQAGWPPFSCLALLRAEASERHTVFNFLQAAAALARDHAPAGLDVLGPASAPMERRAGRHRGQLLLRATARRELQLFLPAWRAALADIETQRRVRWSLDVDPIDLF